MRINVSVNDVKGQRLIRLKQMTVILWEALAGSAEPRTTTDSTRITALPRAVVTRSY